LVWFRPSAAGRRSRVPTDGFTTSRNYTKD